jgi:hypothetical protein
VPLLLLLLEPPLLLLLEPLLLLFEALLGLAPVVSPYKSRYGALSMRLCSCL